MIRHTIIALFVIISTVSSFSNPSVDSILVILDNSFFLNTDLQAHVNITEQDVEQGTKKIELTYYRSDLINSFLIIISSPENERGNGYLRVGKNFWMYLRNTRSFQLINRDESIGGSNADGNDFEKSNLSDLYKPALNSLGKEIIIDDTIGQIIAYQFEIVAKVQDVDYQKKKFWINKANGMILKQADYSNSGTLMETTYFLKYTSIKGKQIPIKILIVDEFEKGNRCVIEISNLSIEKINKDIFTKAYLENLSK